MKTTALNALSLSALLTFSLPASATPVIWTGAIDTNWFVAGNWSPVGVPGNTNEAFLQNGNNVSASGTGIGVNELHVGFRGNPVPSAPFGTGALAISNADLSVINTLRVGVTDAPGIGFQGDSDGTLTTVGGGSAGGDVSVGGGLSVGAFVAGPTGTATGTMTIQSGDLSVVNPSIVNIGRTFSGTSGSADGTLSVAGNFSHGGLTVVGVSGVQQSSGNATGMLTVGGQYDGLGGNGLQIGTAGGSGTATGQVEVGSGIVNSNVLVGAGGGDPNATGASTGTLDVLAGGIHGGNSLSVGFGSGPGQSTGTATVQGGVSVANALSVGAVNDGGSGIGSGDATGVLAIQSGDLSVVNPSIVNIGRTFSGTSGSADGTLSVAGNFSHGGLTVVGVSGVQQSSGNATGMLTVGGQYDGLGGNGLQIGTAGGSGTATGQVEVGSGIVNSNVLVGAGGGDPNATGASTGTLDVLAGGIHGGNSLSVGFGSGPGQSTGTATVQGGVSVANALSVGAVNDGGSGIGSGDATGVLAIQSGDLSVVNPSIVNIGRTFSGTSGSADGTLSVAGNFSHGGLTVVGVSGVQQSSGNATGMLTVGGQYDGLGGNGLQIGTAGGSGTATGQVEVGSGIVNSNVLVGAGGGDPNATGASTGTLDVLAGGIHGGNSLSVGFGSGPGQSTGTATVQGGVSVANAVSVGVIDDGGSGIATGNASGSLILADTGLTADDLRIARLINGSGTATGMLDLGANLASVNNAIEFGDGASIHLAIDGFTRGTQYGAFDTGIAMLDGLLDIAFSFAATSGIFDLIVSNSINGIVGDFDTVNISGLAPGTQFTVGAVVEGGNEIYRLQVGSGMNPVPSPATMACLLVGLAVWRLVTGRRQRVGLSHRRSAT